MRRIPLAARAGTGLALATTAASPLAADVTADEVWTQVRSYFEASGYTVSATREETGGELRLSDLTLSMPMEGGEGDRIGTLTIEVGDLVLTEDGGAVSMDIPSSVPIIAEGDGDAAPDRTVIETMLTGHDFTVSGTPDEMTFDFAADGYAMRLAELVIEGETIGRDLVSAGLQLDEITTVSVVSGGDGSATQVTNETRAAALTYEVAATDFDDPAEGSFEMAGRMSDVAGEGSWTAVDGAEAGDFAAMIEAGFEGDASLSYSEGSTRFTGRGPDGETSGQSVSDNGSIGFSVADGAVGYDVSAEGIAYAVTVPQFPVPLTAEAARLGFALDAPVQAAEEPQPFSLDLALRELAIDDAIWTLFDPEERLSREPATLALSLVGTATPFVNILDPEATNRLAESGGQPGELNTVEIEDLQLSAAGAELTGEGAFTFDNSDTETFDGMPAPEGSATLNLSGAESLIDALVAMGIVGESEAMGARMMLSMFAVLGDDPDTLTSTIEIGEGGRIRANGQRIR
ncbi:hypothetical protein ROJ8625_00779 [Roseivivax jejudonensis]|uniref:DUF2125 domain-containing protein n=1 Tax=Roseivivax jejudonensis TaxID=1529041 RepID=A0A1X6YHH9_9RHOB|nr:DUF2125 domain-containing protein [Roseivivax jejudonensis]SLN21188.1 hypothetical protein ROJ8625_00779 [Roseivivax jejudonensis]